MTRLFSEIIADIPFTLDKRDKFLEQSTGQTLLRLSARAVARPFEVVESEIRNYSAAVVPITSGKGIIPGFTTAVTAILRHIGLSAYTTSKSDIGGFGEAVSRKADLILAADDQQFLALNMNKSNVIDNAWATALGFAQAMAAAAEMIEGSAIGQRALVLGLGPIGCYAVTELKKLGFLTTVYDIDKDKMETFVDIHNDVLPAADLKGAMQEIKYVFDATPAANIIDETMIGPLTVISCPGVPHGLTQAALTKIGPRFIHDNLPLGVVNMALQTIF